MRLVCTWRRRMSSMPLMGTWLPKSFAEHDPHWVLKVLQINWFTLPLIYMFSFISLHFSVSSWLASSVFHKHNVKILTPIIAWQDLRNIVQSTSLRISHTYSFSLFGFYFLIFSKLSNLKNHHLRNLPFQLKMIALFQLQIDKLALRTLAEWGKTALWRR